jgi:ectoine hydroxylase-related dioxygenase (phytanoyl-CoA dioxygenase family)
VLHRDEDVYPLTRPHPPVVVNSMWALTDFTADNGATRLIPGSHRWPANRRPAEDGGETVPATMPAGSVLIYLGGLWHSGGANTTDRPRPGLLLEYVVSWLRPQETQLVAVPPDVARSLPERLQELLGYNVYPPFLGYVDGRHPGRILRSSAP